MPTKESTTNKPKKKVVRRNYTYAVGRRKTSVARVRLFKNGEGKITINEKDYQQYFPHFEFQKMIIAPLKKVGQLTNFNLTIKVTGGGVRGQAEAIRHGISRALIKINKDWRQSLKPLGFLRRDPRMKERKKPGLKRARRAPQWAKR
jgi:small subunit ribosomal protein S9